MDLPGPRIPAIIVKGQKSLPVAVPRQMIAGEQKSVLNQQHAMSFCVARRENADESRSQLPRTFVFENEFRTRFRREFLSMNDSPTTKTLGIALCVSDVVTVGQKDVGNSTERLESPDQLRKKLGRVDQPISLSVPNEIAVAPYDLGELKPQ